MNRAAPVERARTLRALGTLHGVADALRALACGPEDAITRTARKLEAETRTAAAGLFDASLSGEEAAGD